MSRLLIGLVLFCNSFSVFAMDGNELNAKFNSVNSGDNLIALAFVEASVSSIPFLSEEIGYKRPCVSDQVTMGQIYDVVKNYLEDYPEKRHMSGYLLTITAVSVSFQCEGK